MAAAGEGGGSCPARAPGPAHCEGKSPKRTRFRKQHRGRMKGKSYRGNRICFGRYALQIEAGRRAMTRYARRGGKIWVRIFPDKLVTIRPTETPVVKPGRILYEMSGVSETVARAAISIAASKMPIRSQFLRLEI
ncbi:hypothetical protein PVAP13_5KG000550 [Panicum virgatum]|uniref:50S ribosomal protein L16, chloroplastic n=1 Tax=Panicum virgatum TaxID=38727 RepID=A0A8T0S7G3_PANVG|nr:hypothetical protein PVAP13_5KG000550 [Panicum virgatum]